MKLAFISCQECENTKGFVRRILSLLTINATWNVISCKSLSLLIISIGANFILMYVLINYIDKSDCVLVKRESPKAQSCNSLTTLSDVHAVQLVANLCLWYYIPKQ